MGKKIKIILSSLIFVFSNMYSAGLQTQLNNGMWQAVGIQGAYTVTSVAVGYSVDPAFEFYDVADENTTWVALSTADPTQLIYNGPAGQTATYGITTQLNAVIGLFSIRNQRSKKLSNFTILDGSDTNVVKMKITDPLGYRNDIPMYRMYVEGQAGVPAFRLDFQADYQGKSFKLKFGEEEESYIGYFDYSNTYDNPAAITLDIGSSSNIGSGTDIVDAIDFNITDNNVTQLLTTNDYRIKDASGAYAPEFRPYSADVNNRIEAYNMVGDTTWTRFDTANSLASSNTLTRFIAGRGYWVRATSQQSHDDRNDTKIGIITSDSVRINEQEIYGTLGNGWHMLTFEESDLRYAPSGVFVPFFIYAQAIVPTSFPPGVTIHFNRHGSTSTDLAQIRGNDLNTSRIAGVDTSLTIFPQSINLAARASNLLFGNNINMRAYPAVDVDPNSPAQSFGTIILSDSLFEVNSSNTSITTLAGAPLQATSRGLFSSRYGEFVLGMKLTEVNGTDINASIGIAMPKFRATDAIVNDLNYTTGRYAESLRAIKTGLAQAATLSGSSIPATRSTGYLTNFDFNESAFSAAALNAVTYPHILLAAGARFSIADRTYTRLYKFEQNGRFRVSGSVGNREVTPTILDTNITNTITAINAVTANTGVVATDLGEDYFMITSGGGAVSLEEDYNATLFTDIPLGSALIPAASRDLTRGAVSEVYSHRDLLDRALIADLGLMDANGSGPVFGDSNVSWLNIYRYALNNDANGTPNTEITSPKLSLDLRNNAVWALDFPIKQSLIQKFATYNKEITNISIQQFSHDNISYYDFLDLTKDPDDWYGNTYNTNADLRFNDDYQGIFHIYRNTNYWVKLRDKTPLPNQVMSSSSSITYTAKPAFNNRLTDGIGATQNHIAHSLNVKFNKAFIDPLSKDYYNVVAIIGGIKYYLRDNGSYFSLDINDLDMNLASKAPGIADDAIFINAYDGEGNIFKEEGTQRSRFSVYFRKPPTPIVSFDSQGMMQVTNKGSYDVQRYATFISDIPSKRANDMIADLNSTRLSWEASGDEDTYGQVIPTRIVLKDANYELFSDIKTTLYAPLYEGHVLRVTSTKRVERIPYSYIQKQMLTHQDAGSSTFAPYNGSNGVDNGIQLSMEQGAVDKDIYLSYYPEGAESQRRITQFGGTRTMYIALSEDSSTNDNAVASITYLPSYENKMFYLYYNNNLYQGRFQANDTYNNDSSAYDLSTSTLSIDAIANSASSVQTLPATTHGYRIESGSTTAQAIIIPQGNTREGSLLPPVPIPSTPIPATSAPP